MRRRGGLVAARSSISSGGRDLRAVIKVRL